MASCTQIDNVLQAYVDNALGHSERLILEHHVEECARCKKLLRAHQQSSARLFETLADQRLHRDLVPAILENLPEMDNVPFDVASLNKRAKHPRVIRERTRRLIPVAAAVLLVVLAGVIRENWPERGMDKRILGVITSTNGEAYRVTSETNEETLAELSSFVKSGEIFQTAPGATLMLTIMGPTTVKLNEKTRIVVHDSRRISVTQGEALLDVGKDDKVFKVLTPSGEITVFGTTFDVLVQDDRTEVVVEEGHVQVETEDETYQPAKHLVEKGQQVTVSRGRALEAPKKADVSRVTKWARHIVADEAAKAIFVNKVQANHETSEASGGLMYLLHTNNQPVKAIRIRWDRINGILPTNHCDYAIYVYTDVDYENLLFKGIVDGSVFSDRTRTSYELPNTGDRETPQRVIFVKPVSLCSDRELEVSFDDNIDVLLVTKKEG